VALLRWWDLSRWDCHRATADSSAENSSPEARLDCVSVAISASDPKQPFNSSDLSPQTRHFELKWRAAELLSTAA